MHRIWNILQQWNFMQVLMYGDPIQNAQPNREGEQVYGNHWLDKRAVLAWGGFCV